MENPLFRSLSLLALLSTSSLGCGDTTLTASPDAITTSNAKESGPAPDLALLVEPTDASIDDVGAGGTLIVEGGCTYLDGTVGQRTVIVWPHGTTWNAQESAVERSGGIAPFNDPPFKLLSGDYLRATGNTVTMAAALTSSIAPGSAEVLERCAEGEGGVVLLRAEVGIESPPKWVPPTTGFAEIPTS